MDADDEGLMPPPWAKYPGKSLASMWFKQGSGEWYVQQFYRWWDAQPADVRRRLIERYPLPPEWAGGDAHKMGRGGADSGR